MEDGSKMGRVVMGVFVAIVLAIVLVPVAVLGWLRFGAAPVAVSDPPFPFEGQIAGFALNARIHREMVKTPPIQADGDTLVAGADLYNDHCAGCHGLYGKPSPMGARMYPDAPQLWEKHRQGNAVGVSDDPPGETCWKVANGIRLTGMPSFKGVLTDTEMWQVSLLLANADKPLPPAAVFMLRGEQMAPATPAALAAPAAAK
jgi:mono/diheme cytochrome c family protein